MPLIVYVNLHTQVGNVVDTLLFYCWAVCRGILMECIWGGRGTGVRGYAPYKV